MRDPSCRYRWLLLAASLVTIVFLVGAAVRENYLAEWKTVQHEYRDLLRQKATDDRGRELLAKFRVEIKQASVPALGTVDRCVSCHNGVDDPRMSDVALPHRTHPGQILDKHPVDPRTDATVVPKTGIQGKGYDLWSHGSAKAHESQEVPLKDTIATWNLSQERKE